MADGENKEQPIIIKKVKKTDGGHHGGAWKVAYADFVTAMMALFIVLWVLSASTSVQMKITAYFDDPGAFNFFTGKRTVPVQTGLKPEPGKVIGDKIGDGGGGIKDNDISEQYGKDQYRQLMEEAKKDSIETAEKLKEMSRDLKDYIEGMVGENSDFNEFKNSVKFTYTDEGIKIDLIETKESLFFKVGSSKLKEKGKRIMTILAGKIGKLPNSVEIQGHTDSRKYSGSSPGGYSNWDLSTDRANATRKYMNLKGLWKGQINEVSGYADKELLNPENPFANENRRVTIYIKHVNTKDFLEKELEDLEADTFEEEPA